MEKLLESYYSNHKDKFNERNVDLDNFKVINDTYGHKSGDDVLRGFASILRSFTRREDAAARIGGDEFALLFKGCSTEETRKICEYLRTQMVSCPLRNTDDKRVTLSCGVVSIDPENADLEMLKNAADSALYAAKDNGRDQVVIYNELVPSPESC